MKGGGQNEEEDADIFICSILVHEEPAPGVYKASFFDCEEPALDVAPLWSEERVEKAIAVVQASSNEVTEDPGGTNITIEERQEEEEEEVPATTDSLDDVREDVDPTTMIIEEKEQEHDVVAASLSGVLKHDPKEAIVHINERAKELNKALASIDADPTTMIIEEKEQGHDAVAASYLSGVLKHDPNETIEHMNEVAKELKETLASMASMHRWKESMEDTDATNMIIKEKEPGETALAAVMLTETQEDRKVIEELDLGKEALSDTHSSSMINKEKGPWEEAPISDEVKVFESTITTNEGQDLRKEALAATNSSKEVEEDSDATNDMIIKEKEPGEDALAAVKLNEVVREESKPAIVPIEKEELGEEALPERKSPSMINGEKGPWKEAPGFDQGLKEFYSTICCISRITTSEEKELEEEALAATNSSTEVKEDSDTSNDMIINEREQNLELHQVETQVAANLDEAKQDSDKTITTSDEKELEEEELAATNPSNHIMIFDDREQEVEAQVAANLDKAKQDLDKAIQDLDKIITTSEEKELEEKELAETYPSNHVKEGSDTRNIMIFDDREQEVEAQVAGNLDGAKHLDRSLPGSEEGGLEEEVQATINSSNEVNEDSEAKTKTIKKQEQQEALASSMKAWEEALASAISEVKTEDKNDGSSVASSMSYQSSRPDKYDATWLTIAKDALKEEFNTAGSGSCPSNTGNTSDYDGDGDSLSDGDSLLLIEVLSRLQQPEMTVNGASLFPFFDENAGDADPYFVRQFKLFVRKLASCGGTGPNVGGY